MNDLTWLTGPATPLEDVPFSPLLVAACICIVMCCGTVIYYLRHEAENCFSSVTAATMKGLQLPFILFGITNGICPVLRLWFPIWRLYVLINISIAIVLFLYIKRISSLSAEAARQAVDEETASSADSANSGDSP